MANIKEIKVDVDKIKFYAQQFSEMGQELNDAKEALKTAMKEVAEGWKGQGAKTFNEMLDADWATGVDRYCELLTLLVDILNDAASTYDTMESNIKALRYKSY